ncbi:MAG TPA: HAD family phosphatase [Methylomirabilota bacterium]|nr:HAD family phosphatase [Methylomirabilota bacterium]
MTRADRRVAVFDMDGVLVNNSRFHREAWRRLAREEGFALTDPEFWRQAIGRPVDEAVPRILGRLVTREEAARLARRKTALYHELADGHAEPVPGVVEFVHALAVAGVPRALATSAVADSAARILEGLGLAGAFTVQVTAGHVRRGKPDPEVYLTAAARLGVLPAACVVFEDAVVGVEAARRAGMAVVGLTAAHADAELREAGAAWTAPDFTGLVWAALASP